MGILDSFKKALSGKTNAEPDEATVAAPEAADEEAVEAEPVQAVESLPTADEPGSYTVQSGDTLWSIAEAAYGDGSKYPEIFAANADLLEQPERILPGQKLLIPELDG